MRPKYPHIKNSLASYFKNAAVMPEMDKKKKKKKKGYRYNV